MGLFASSREQSLEVSTRIDSVRIMRNDSDRPASSMGHHESSETERADGPYQRQGTAPKRAMVSQLQRARRRVDTDARDLPGCPDFVSRRAKVTVFVDGDFWHGWRFSVWRSKLSEKWESKIAANRRCDAQNHARLMRAGWTVIRQWEHQIERDPELCLRRVLAATSRQPGARQRRQVGSPPVESSMAGL